MFERILRVETIWWNWSLEVWRSCWNHIFPQGITVVFAYLVGSESADESSLDDSESSQYEQQLQFLHLSNEISLEESKSTNVMAFLFHHFGLRLLQSYLTEKNGAEDLPFNSMVIDALLKKVINDFTSLLVSIGNQELKSFFQVTGLKVQQVQSGWEEELRRLEHHIKGLEVASSSYEKVLEENRMLYNLVEDLKGTIRVYCRVRPCLPGQFDGHSTVGYIGVNGSIMIANPHKQGQDARRVFTFNKLFGTNVTQHKIFVDAQPLIRSVLDGYNICIFAYGQIGSGKTYTMIGPDLTTEAVWGVNYRSLCDLFQISKARLDTIEYEVGVQMIEIYNEQVRDLLMQALIPVSCTQDVLELMRIGQRIRAVGATALNERSSCSHSILAVHVRGKELVSGFILKGCWILLEVREWINLKPLVRD